MDSSIIPDAARRLNILVAYPYLKPDVAAFLAQHRDRVRLVVDSGAFTAWKAGKPIALDDYCRFLEGLPCPPWRYFTLDVIGDPERTQANYETMLRRGFRPVPIFTRGEDPAALDHYYETSDVVGVGGLVGTDRNKGFINGIMRRVGKRKVHWLGFTNASYLRVYRPYMCDSSSWSMGQRRRFIPVYMGNAYVQQFKRHEFVKGFPPLAAERVRLYGADPAMASSAAGWSGSSPLITDVGICSYVHMSLDVQRHLGTHVFLAMADLPSIRNAVRGYDRLASLLKGFSDDESTGGSLGRTGQHDMPVLGQAEV